MESPGEADAMTSEETSVVIIGAGPAGIGLASLLAQCGVASVVLERGRVGESFLSWPKETRFISPSFTGNFFGSVDLNAITPDSSPAFGLQSEHPTGAEYCKYLNDVVGHHKLDVRTGVTVTAISGAEKYDYVDPSPPPPPQPPPQQEGGHGDGGGHHGHGHSHGEAGSCSSEHSAAPSGGCGHGHGHGHGHGESVADAAAKPASEPGVEAAAVAAAAAQSPAEASADAAKAAKAAADAEFGPDGSYTADFGNSSMITIDTSDGPFGAKFVIWAGGEFQYPKTIPHTVRPGKSYADFPVGKHVIIGGSESGMDAAYQLVQLGSEVVVLDENATWEKRVSDSSYGLSPHTCGRVREMLASGKAKFIAERAISITAEDVRTKSHAFVLEHPAIDCTGFDMTQSLAGGLFEFVQGHCGVTARLTIEDESTQFRNVFLTGPTVVHDKAVFCFIYKYRQRWAVVAKEILMRMGRFSDVIAHYHSKGFMLEDLSCCANSCSC